MSGHYYRVGVHGPPDPKKHPWVMVKWDGNWWRPVDVAAAPGRRWTENECWFPVEAPPSELAPEPEDQGVEVRGYLYRQRWDGDVEVMRDGKWLRTGTPEMYRDYAEIAQALGLVDQPPVPRALVDTVRRWADEEAAAAKAPTHDQFHNGTWAAYRRVLSCLERGEFGPVEPSMEWVTDRLPNDDEYPVLWNATDTGETAVFGADRWDRLSPMSAVERWMSLSVLLDAAGLGER